MKTHWARHSEAAKEADRPQPNGNVERTVGPVSADGGAHIDSVIGAANFRDLRMGEDKEPRTRLKVAILDVEKGRL